MSTTFIKPFLFLNLITSQKIVPKESAILGLPKEQAIAMNANHEEICRFSSEEDEDYKHVSRLIVDLVNSEIEGRKGLTLVERLCNLDTSSADDLVKPSFCKFAN